MSKKSIHIGARGERLVKELYEKAGFEVYQSPGSRGAADLKARKPGGPAHNIQVKASSQGQPAYPSREEIRRLKISAARDGAVPVLAQVSGNDVKLISLRSGRPVGPKKK